MNYLSDCYRRIEQRILRPNEETEFDLVAFRFCYCLLLAVRLLLESESYELKFLHAPYYIDHSFLTFFGAVSRPSYTFFQLLQFTCITSLILLAFGIKSRWSAFVAIFTFTYCYLIYYAMHLVPSSKYVFHTLNIIPFILLGLAVFSIAPVKRKMSDYLSIKRSNALYCYVVILICFSYTAALLNRVFTMPAQWLSGEFLNNFFAHYGYVTGREFSQLMKDTPYFGILLSWLTAVFELGCWSLLWAGKHRLLVVLTGICFHFMIRWSGFADFVDWFGFSYLIFIPYSKIFIWMRTHFKRFGLVS